MVTLPLTVARADRVVTQRLLNELDGATIAIPGLARSARSLAAGSYYVHANPHANARGGREKLDLLLTLHPEEKVFDERRVLYLPPPGSVTFRVRVPQSGAALEFGTFARGRADVVVTATRTDGAKRALHDERASGVRFRDVRVDLAPFAGEEVALTFSTWGAPPNQAFVSDPVVLGDAGARRDNVLLIVIDTMRADGIGCLGNPRNLSPNIDRVCARGTAFTRAFANGNWTKPSIYSIFTSEYASRTGLNFDAWFFNPGEREAFYARRPFLLPLAFSRAGYVTAGVMNNLFVQGFHRFGVDVGFDQSFDHRHSVYDTPILAARAVEFVTANRDRPWFLYLHFNAPHQIYIPPAKYKAQVKMGPDDRTPDTLARYFGEVAYTDDHVGRVLRAVEDLGLADRTLTVVTGDHGEVMDERHYYHVMKTGRQTLFSHGVSLYDEELHVPLIVAGPRGRPGVVAAGKKVDAVVPMIDLAPTLVELSGLPRDERNQGTSLVPLLGAGTGAGAGGGADRVVFSEGKGTRAIRLDGWKLFTRLPGHDRLERDGRAVRLPEEAFDVTKDPSERENLVDRADARPMVDRLRGELRRYMNDVATRVAAAPMGREPEAARSVERYHMLASGDAGEHRFTGEVVVGGSVVSVRPIATLERSGVWRDSDGKKVLFDLRVRERVSGLAVDVAPANARVVLRGTVDGKPLSRDTVFVGPYGIATAEDVKDGVRVDTAPAVGGKRAPRVRASGELGLFVWRAFRRGGGAALSSAPVASEFEGVELPGAASGEKANDAVEKALREWGYIQAGEKTPGKR